MKSRLRRTAVALAGLAAISVLLGLGWASRRLVLERRDLALLESQDPGEAREAARRLARMGSQRATERLVKLLKEPGDKRPWVSDALRERGSSALALLGAELEDGLDEGDYEVVQFLEDLGADARPAVPSLVRCLEVVDDKDGSFSIAFALLEIDPQGYAQVQPLLRSPGRVARLKTSTGR